MRVYVPASVDDLRRLHETGRLDTDPGRTALAVTPWVLRELGVDDPEDEEAEFAVLQAAADEQVDGSPCAAVLVLEVGSADAAPEGMRVRLGHDLTRRRLAAVHLPPELGWYAAQELPDVLAALT